MILVDPIRIGLVGIVRAVWGMHAPEIEKNIDKATFVAACDIIPERAEAMQKRFPGCKAYTDIDALIADPNVEKRSIAPTANTLSAAFMAKAESIPRSNRASTASG